ARAGRHAPARRRQAGTGDGGRNGRAPDVAAAGRVRGAAAGSGLAQDRGAVRRSGDGDRDRAGTAVRRTRRAGREGDGRAAGRGEAGAGGRPRRAAVGDGRRAGAARGGRGRGEGGGGAVARRGRRGGVAEGPRGVRVGRVGVRGRTDRLLRLH